jgi:hypothetical protein
LKKRNLFFKKEEAIINMTIKPKITFEKLLAQLDSEDR